MHAAFCPLVARSLTCSSSARRQAPQQGMLGDAAGGRGSVRAAGFFKNFKMPSLSNTTAEDAGIYASQGSRADYDKDDVEQYFNYMGILAVDKTYDRFNAFMNTGVAPVDILLLMAAKENDVPKIEELLRAGADPLAKDPAGKNAHELATAATAQSALKKMMK